MAMNKEDLLPFLGTRITITLLNGFHYTGYIREFTSDSVVFTDKYNKQVLARLDMITMVEEVKKE